MYFISTCVRRVVVVHTFNPSTGRQRQVDLCEFKASLVYRASSRTGSKATEKHCLKKTNQPTNQEMNTYVYTVRKDVTVTQVLTTEMGHRVHRLLLPLSPSRPRSLCLPFFLLQPVLQAHWYNRMLAPLPFCNATCQVPGAEMLVSRDPCQLFQNCTNL